MVVVIAILGLTAVLVLSHGPPHSLGAAQTAAETDLVQQLRLARSRAIAAGATSTLLIDASRRLLLLDGVAQTPLPPTIPLSLDDGDGHPARLIAFRFAPDGSAQGQGGILLGQKPAQRRIGVNWLTGAVEIAHVR
ncbi:hypothetical protein Acid7E03_31270 [Acidisoma sp. 7E03]